MESKYLRIAKTWLIYVSIGLLIACGVLYREWQTEKYNTMTAEIEAAINEWNANYYQRLYNDCLEQGISQNITELGN